MTSRRLGPLAPFGLLRSGQRAIDRGHHVAGMEQRERLQQQALRPRATEDENAATAAWGMLCGRQSGGTGLFFRRGLQKGEVVAFFELYVECMRSHQSRAATPIVQSVAPLTDAQRGELLPNVVHVMLAAFVEEQAR